MYCGHASPTDGKQATGHADGNQMVSPQQAPPSMLDEPSVTVMFPSEDALLPAKPQMPHFALPTSASEARSVSRPRSASSAADLSRAVSRSRTRGGSSGQRSSSVSTHHSMLPLAHSADKSATDGTMNAFPLSALLQTLTGPPMWQQVAAAATLAGRCSSQGHPSQAREIAKAILSSGDTVIQPMIMLLDQAHIQNRAPNFNPAGVAAVQYHVLSLFVACLRAGGRRVAQRLCAAGLFCKMLELLPASGANIKLVVLALDGLQLICAKGGQDTIPPLEFATSVMRLFGILDEPMAAEDILFVIQRMLPVLHLMQDTLLGDSKLRKHVAKACLKLLRHADPDVAESVELAELNCLILGSDDKDSK